MEHIFKRIENQLTPEMIQMLKLAHKDFNAPLITIHNDVKENTIATN